MKNQPTIRARLYWLNENEGHLDEDYVPGVTNQITRTSKDGKKHMFRPSGQTDEDGRVVFLEVPHSDAV